MATSGTDGSVAERLWESSVARPAKHASHQLRNVACLTSCSSLSLSVGKTGALFTLACLSSSTSTSPLSCLPSLDSCSTSGKRLDDCSSQGITYTPFCFRSSTKPRQSPNSFSIFLADFTSRMNPPSPFSHTVRHLSSSNDRFCHVSHVEPSFDFLSTNTHAEELGTDVSNSRAVRLMQWDLF